MTLKEGITDTFDSKPISNKVTLYAVGTALEGLALGLYLSKSFQNVSGWIISIIFIIGAILAVSSYSFIKRKCRITRIK